MSARGMLPAQTAGRSCRKPSGFLDPPAPLTGLPAGTIYPIIARLERYGWLESRWEDPTKHEAERRPRRRYYRFTSDGAEQARLALAPARRPPRSAAVPWHGAPRRAQPGTVA